MDEDDADVTTQLLQSLLQRLTARSREVSAAAQEHGHATTQPSSSSMVGGHLPLAGAVDGSAEHETPRNNNGGAAPGGHPQRLLDLFEHEEASLEEVTEMLRRGSSSSDYFDQIMEFAMRLPEDDDIGDIFERIYEQAVAAGVLTPVPEDSDQHHGDDDGMLAEQIFHQALAAGQVLIPLPEEWPDQRDDDGVDVDGGRGFGGVRPASSGVVAGLEKRKYQRSAGEEDDDSQCPICLMDYAVDDDLCVMPCKHGFHEGCLAGWLARSCLCPLCRHHV